MGLISKIIVCVFGAVLLLIGAIGTFNPAELSAQLGLELPSAVATGQVRAMIGAHYLAMGVVCLFAAARNLPALLFPIGLIEVMMVLARIIAGINGEFDASVVGPTVLELVMGATLLALSRRGFKTP
ncbi:MAG: DUF4345 family protein [Henriciella sp.]